MSRTANPPSSWVSRDQIYDMLGISGSSEDQAHTREFLSELMMELDIRSFRPHKTRADFRTALIRDITSPDGQLCTSIRTAHANNSDECLFALQKLARLVKKAWVDYFKNHPVLQDDADTDADSGPAPGPGHTQAATQAVTQACNPAVAPAATDTTTTAAATATSTSMPGITAAGTAPNVQPSTGPDTDQRCWIPDVQFYFREVDSDPTFPDAEFRLSDILSNPAGQTSTLLHTTWVDSGGLRFIRFVDALSQGLGRSIPDLTEMDIWLRVVHPTTQAALELEIGQDDGELGMLEEAFNTIMEQAMTYSYNGVLPAADSSAAYELMRTIFMEE